MDEITQFLYKYKQIPIILHVFSVIIGMGSALVSDILFNLYIKDKKINPTENKTLEVLSRVIWISLGLIVLSGMAIFLSDPLKYAESTKFLVKVIIVGVIILNGYLFWELTHRSLRKLDFNDTNINHKYVKIRKLSFAFGAISIISWISAFILGSISSIPVSLAQALIIYLVVIIFGIIMSQIVEYLITRK